MNNRITIRKASLNDEEGVVNLLENFYPGVPNHWRKIFTPRNWVVEDDFPGFVIVDQQKIVGFLGTLFSEHETPKGKVKICNLTTWYVEPEYRQHGLTLFLKVMKTPNVSWTNLTAAPHTYEWLSRSGFKTLNDRQVLILPLPKLFGRNRQKQITITDKFSKTDLQPNLHNIFHMHQNLHCKPILITHGNQQCLCLLVVTRYKKIPLAKIYYVSDTDLFNAVIDRIRFELCYKLRVCYLQVEGNIMHKTNMHGVFVKAMHPPRLYKSNILTKDEVTLLGSELFVLGI